MIALIAPHGQLGAALAERLTGDVLLWDRDTLDITDPEAVEETIRIDRPEIVINTAAYNLVDRAEDEPEAAYAVNSLGPKQLAVACARNGAALVHVSTDYVFGADVNRMAPYRETDEPGPLGEYGRSKLAGERWVASICPRHFIVRTCGLYGRATSGKGNFVKTMLRLAGEGKPIAVVNDQRCTPTSTVDLADAIARLVATDRYGLYHATNAGATTWHDFAAAIFRLTGTRADLRPIPSADYKTAARRPSYSVLDCGKLAGLGIALSPWEDALAAYLATNSRDPR
ncbi:MAG: dTDP-4-dehydrorhamnose reductase [Planctomycetaceae bacterium]